MYPDLSSKLLSLSGWKKNYYITASNIRDFSYPTQSLNRHSIGQNNIMQLINTVIREFEQFLHVKLGEPSDIKRRVLDRKRDRSKFVEIMLHTLNEEDNE